MVLAWEMVVAKTAQVGLESMMIVVFGELVAFFVLVWVLIGMWLLADCGSQLVLGHL